MSDDKENRIYKTPVRRVRALGEAIRPDFLKPPAGFKKVRRSRLIDGPPLKQKNQLRGESASRRVLGELKPNVAGEGDQQVNNTPPMPVAKAPEGLGLSSEDPGSRAEAERMMHRLKRVGDWQLLSLLGMGGMANVYLAQHCHASERYAAIKLTKDCILDTQDRENDTCYSSTMLEWRTYQLFCKDPPPGTALNPIAPAMTAALTVRPEKRGSLTPACRHVRPCKLRKIELTAIEGHGALPAAYEYGFVEAPPHRRQHGWISLQLLGLNLHAVATDKTSPLTWEAFFRMATGMLAAVRELHLRDLVHRDIKPGNFCLGWRDDNHIVYLVDFGFAVPLPKKVQITALGNNEKFCGTPDFASSNALRGGRCGAKDDCESLAYSYLQLWNYGTIPWDITRMAPRDACKASSADSSILMADMGWTPQRLRRMADDRTLVWRFMEEKRDIPQFLLSWQLYLSSLSVWELPNYDLLKKLLCNSHLSWSRRCRKASAGGEGDTDPDISSLSGSARGRAANCSRLVAPEE